MMQLLTSLETNPSLLVTDANALCNVSINRKVITVDTVPKFGLTTVLEQKSVKAITDSRYTVANSRLLKTSMTVELKY